jgi:hypothetical protein
MSNAFAPFEIDKDEFNPIRKDVIVTDMVFDERITHGGLILLSDNGKGTGIRPRWGQVYAVGPEQTEVSVGQWVCIAHGRWTRGIQVQDADGEKIIRKVDYNDILLVSDEKPMDETHSTAVHIEKQTM